MLYELPLGYWIMKGFNVVASGIGKPLYLDRRTYGKARIDYASVCIEVSAMKELVREGNVCDNKCNDFTLYVGYDWGPDMCSSWQCFGHTTAACGNTTQHIPVTAPNQSVNKDSEEWIRVERKRKGKASHSPVAGNPMDGPSTAELLIGIFLSFCSALCCTNTF